MPPKLSKVRQLREDVLSNSSTRSPSRVRTPLPDGEENGALDINFRGIEELLASKLESLQSILDLQDLEDHEKQDMSQAETKSDAKQRAIVELNKARIQSELTTINQVIFSLSRPRSEVSSQSREMLLAQLYKLVVTKPIVVYNEEQAGTPNYVSEANVDQLVKILLAKDYRSPSEFLLLFRSVIGLLASDLTEFGDLVHVGFFEEIEALIRSSSGSQINDENKASVITGYAGLLLVLYADTSAFGIDEKITWLTELADGYVQNNIILRHEIDSGDREHSTLLTGDDDKKLLSEQEQKIAAEGHIASSLIHAVSVLLTLLPRGQFLNELLVETLVPKFVEILDNESDIDSAKAAGKAIALAYELFDYEIEEDDDDEYDAESEYNPNAPYYEQEALLSICDRLAGLSSKKVAKRSKKDVHSVFSEVASTIRNFTNPTTRVEIYKRSPAGLEILNSSISSTHLKLSRSKSLPINSWFLYFRLLHLKWCFGFGLHSQIVSNSDIRDILKEPLTKYQEKYNNDPFDDIVDQSGFRSGNAISDTERFARVEKKRANDLKKARVNKLTEKMDTLDLNVN